MKNIPLALTIFLVLSTQVLAQNKVVVIPIAGDDLKPLENIVSVATSGGDFTSPVTAVNSITDASASNPYLIVIAPGIYDIGSDQLVMKEYVSIAGSGQSISVIRGQRDKGSGGSATLGALLVGASNTELRDLTIENLNGANSTTYGIVNSGTTNQTIFNVRVNVVSNKALQGWGVLNSAGASPLISHSKISVTGTKFDNRGIENQGASRTKIVDSEIIITGSDDEIELNQAVINRSTSNITLDGVRITITEITDSFGAIENTNSARVTLLNSSIDMEEGVGVKNSSSTAAAVIRNSRIDVGTGFVSIAASTGSGISETYISDSLLNIGVSGTPKCSFVFEFNATALDDDCNQVIP